jgi:hypothetical protein
LGRGPISDRSFGGLATLVKKTLFGAPQLVRSEDPYIIVQINELIICNVGLYYMPASSVDDREALYADVLASILNDIEDISFKDLIVVGDFNCSLTIGSPLRDLTLDSCNSASVSSLLAYWS